MRIGMAMRLGSQLRGAGVIAGPFGDHETLADGLVSYWTLDETSGTRFDSVVASANDLTDNNTVGSAAGMLNNAASFVAASSQKLTKIGATFNAADYMISMWFKPTTSAGFKTVLMLGDNWTANVVLHVDRNGTTLRLFTSEVVGLSFDASGILLQLDAWNHIVAWYDSSDKKVRGKLNGSATIASAALSGTRNNATKFTLGGEPTGAPFDQGLIDEVGLWSRVPTGNEPADLYNSGAGLFYGD